MKTAACYCRISDEDQSQYSLPSQQAECEKTARAKGFNIPPEFVFIDNGGKSTEIDRAALTAMREAVRSGVVGMVVIYDLDRLARKVSHQLLLLEEFQKHGVAVEFVNAPTENTPEGKMLLMMRGMFSEYEREKIRERTVRGSRQRARDGKINGGVPYGYLVQPDGTPGIHPEHSKVVRSIFRLMIEGMSSSEIAVRLTADGVAPPKRRGPWIRGSVLGIASRKVYATGILAWNKTALAEPQRRRKAAKPGKSKLTSVKRRPETEWITMSIPPLTDMATFERVQKAIQKNRRGKSGRPSRTFLLTGLIRCGVCGAAVCGTYSHGWCYYRCTGRNPVTGRRTCGLRGVRLEKLEAATLEAIRDVLTRPKRLAAEVNGHAAELESNQTRHRAEQKKLTVQVDRLKKQEFNCRRSMLDADLGDSYQAFRDELKTILAQRRDCERRLESLVPARTLLREMDVTDLCRTAKARFDNLGREAMRTLLRTVVDTIRFLPDDLKINMAVDVPAAMAALEGGMTTNCQSGLAAVRLDGALREDAFGARGSGSGGGLHRIGFLFLGVL